jgi:hypothetical protein
MSEEDACRLSHEGRLGARVLVEREDPPKAHLLGSSKIGDNGEAWNARSLVNHVNFVVQPAAFFRRAAFEAAGGLDIDLHYVMDYDLWIRLGSRGGVHYLPQVLAEVRMYPETKTSSGGLPRFEEMERMIRRHGRRTVPADFEPEILEALTQACERSIRGGHVGETLGHLQRLVPYGFEVAGRRTVRRLRRSLHGTGF